MSAAPDLCGLYEATRHDPRRAVEEHPELAEILLEELLLDAQGARESPSAFFDFALRAEEDQSPIKTAAHQQVVLDFILAHPDHENPRAGQKPGCVIRMPVGHSKTYTTAGLALWLLGRNVAMRGAIVSATQAQAEKPLGMIRSYVEESPEVRLVFPHLRKSTRYGDPWTQTKLTVARPAGIRDASLIAAGLFGALDGSRLGWILVDDILNFENTSTPEWRKKVFDWISLTVRSRLDPKGGRMIFTNTPWHPDDATYELEKRGWPTLTMRADGTILITNTDWDSLLLRPLDLYAREVPESLECRLAPLDPDPSGLATLWPERVDQAKLDEYRREYLPQHFEQLFQMNCRDDASALCKAEYVEKCKELAREMRWHAMVPFWEKRQDVLVFTGVDLAVSQDARADESAIFVMGVYPDKTRRVLWIEHGRWSAGEIVDRVLASHERYGGVIAVENNGAQDYLRQVLLQKDKSLPIKPHTTGKAKANPAYGVPAIFTEMMNGAWAIPNDKHGACEKAVAKFVEQSLHYQPSKHTGDVLMAAYFARDLAKKFGALTSMSRNPAKGSISMNLMAR